MDRILLPLDGSRSADNAIGYIISRKAELMNAEIHLLNVQPPVSAGKLARVLAADDIAAIRMAAGQEVLRPARDALKRNSMRFTARVLLGQPAESIVRYAAIQNCTSIVIGTRARGPFKNLVLGSVPTTVVHLSTVPVTLVKSTSSGSAEVRTRPRSREADRPVVELPTSAA